MSQTTMIVLNTVLCVLALVAIAGVSNVGIYRSSRAWLPSQRAEPRPRPSCSRGSARSYVRGAWPRWALAQQSLGW